MLKALLGLNFNRHKQELKSANEHYSRLNEAFDSGIKLAREDLELFKKNITNQINTLVALQKDLKQHASDLKSITSNRVFKNITGISLFFFSFTITYVFTSPTMKRSLKMNDPPVRFFMGIVVLTALCFYTLFGCKNSKQKSYRYQALITNTIHSFLPLQEKVNELLKINYGAHHRRESF